MEGGFYLTVFILFLLSIITIVIFKIYRFIQKFNEVYNYFIRSKKDLRNEKINFTMSKGIPPINGECPTKEELENTNV